MVKVSQELGALYDVEAFAVSMIGLQQVLEFVDFVPRDADCHLVGIDDDAKLTSVWGALVEF